MFQRGGSIKRSSSKRYDSFDDEALLGIPGSSGVDRKVSLVRPERNNLNDPHNPHYYYAQVAAQEQDHINVNPSSTGVDPIAVDRADSRHSNVRLSGEDLNDKGVQLEDLSNQDSENSYRGQTKGRTIYGLNDEYESPFKGGNSTGMGAANSKRNKKAAAGQESKLSFWKAYCYVVTFWAPGSLLKLFGMPKKDRQMAWREKIALITVIIYLGAFVAYLTFGFTRTVCKGSVMRMRNNEINTGYLIINGKAYDLTSSSHPAAAGVPAGSNILYPPINAGGQDASFLFQNVNGNCKGLIKPRDNCTIPNDNDDLAWYMPCKLFSQDGSTAPNFTVSEYYDGWACHTSQYARDAFYGLETNGDVYFTWDDIRNSTRNLVVYSGNVLDLDLLDWIQSDDLEYPNLFDELKNAEMGGYDISLLLASSSDRKAARCLSEIVKVGVVDAESIGCIASQVVLYVSLVFILSIVFVKFAFACYFKWIIAPKQGADVVDAREMNKRDNEREDWAENQYSLGPIKQPELSKRSSRLDFLKSNRLSMYDMDKLNDSVTPSYNEKGMEMTTMAVQAANKSNFENRSRNNLSKHNSISANVALSPFGSRNPSISNLAGMLDVYGLDPDIIHHNVIPQPPVDFQPFGYPLAHTMNLVTCYSEDEAGLRTTLDSVATTDYPNSHKLIVILCDGLIKGSGNDKTTPDIALSMMTDFVVEPENVKAHSYVAVAQGSKRHNMAKVYGGFYKYDNATVSTDRQQRVPIICIVKCGTPSEATSAKPGNRGKRDSQIILMSFLQKVTFDERMTELEFDILLNIWRITGLLADMYEIVLMVDADTKVYPDSMTHMVGAMVKDPMVMGLCGETKIANKRQSWVTAIQVFEYFISHHQAKAFESMFGGVTCLPGCFCMYRVKTPKSNDGYWVPILANPDIVERYSDNVVDTLHKKNLLLLGEDRFLSTLMLKTFPKRKQIFVSKAVCKTIVPDNFKVLLSQRRRWINSTVHNLMELVLVKDLCGTFCFSMQFIVGVELVGTLVLPAAISFTIYVIIISIVSKPTPILSLVLLAIILGIPGLLIVVTASRWSYLVWMLIYLLALPIWNFVLPAYAYWKFDDFSWGETRTIAGGDKGHEDGEGEFDHSKIKMRRWREFERERQVQNSQLEAPRSAWNPVDQKDQPYILEDEL
jgi:chitin synthase